MDDDDPEVRFITCGAVQECCVIVEGLLDSEQVIIPWIQNRL